MKFVWKGEPDPAFSSRTSVIGYPEYRFFSNSSRIHAQILSNPPSRVAVKSRILFPDSRTA